MHIYPLRDNLLSQSAIRGQSRGTATSCSSGSYNKAMPHTVGRVIYR